MQEIIDRTSYRPAQVNVSEIASLVKSHPEISVVDQYNQQLEELFLLRNPQYKFNKEYKEPLQNFIIETRSKQSPEEDGTWFYFPWNNQLVHYLPEDLHFEMRTGRNKNLISKEEQSAYYNSCVAVCGMSVGSHVAVTIAMTGGAKHFKLADPDSLSGDNLNRIRIGYGSVGTPKVVAGARQIVEINPYVLVEIFNEGVTAENVGKILDGAPKPNVLVEEMDNPYWKLKIREEAKARGIPVLMGTDNGDGVIVDIERYDTDANLPTLNGLAGDLTADKLKAMNPTDLPKVAATIAGANFAPVRMIESVSEVGKSLYSWPQLGTSANMCGSVITYLARRIILKVPEIVSGRYAIDFDAVFEKDFASREGERNSAKAEIFKKMGL